MVSGALQSFSALTPGDHLCCLYDSAAEHCEVLVSYIWPGLENGGAVLYLADGGHSDTVEERLRREGVGVDAVQEEGRFVVADAASLYLHGGFFDPEIVIAEIGVAMRKALDGGAVRFRVASDMSWAVDGPPGSERLVEYEGRLARAFRGEPWGSLALFDTRRFDSDSLLVMLSVHSKVALGTGIYRNIFYMSLEEMLGTELARGTLTQRLRLLMEWEEKERRLTAEQKKAGEYLRIAEIVFVALNEKGEVTLVNDKACALLGRSRADILGKDWFDSFLPAGTNTEAKAVFLKLMSDECENVERYENPIVTARGEERLIAWRNTVLRNEEGDITGTLSAGTDITQERKLEEALREREHQYRILAEEMPDMVCVVSRDFDVLFVNPAGARQLGLSVDALLGKRLPDVLPPNVGAQFEQLRAVLKTGREVYHEESYRFGEREVWLGTRLVPYEVHDGRVESVLAVSRDISSLKQTERRLREREERYRRLFQESGDAVFVHDLDGRLLEVNQRACSLLGADEETLLRTCVVDLHPDEEQPVCAWAFETVKERGYVRFQTRFRRMDGILVHVDISASIVDSVEGVVQAVAREAPEVLGKGENTMEIVGTWLYSKETPMGPATMRVESKWTFQADGAARLQTDQRVVHDGNEMNHEQTDDTGTWLAEDDLIAVTIAGHTDSPFRISFESESRIREGKTGGIWDRE